MDIKQMKDFVSQELKGLKQEHRLLSLRKCLQGTVLFVRGGKWAGAGPLVVPCVSPRSGLWAWHSLTL